MARDRDDCVLLGRVRQVRHGVEPGGQPGQPHFRRVPGQGIGFGISQNVTFTLMIDRAPASGYGTASALWNLAYDAGYGAGPAVFGAFAAHTGTRRPSP